MRDRRRLLVTGADSPLGRAVVASVCPTANVRAVDRHIRGPLPDGATAYEGDLRDASFVARMLEDVEAIVHLAPLHTQWEDAGETLDHATRSTYHLATLAPAAGVQRLVLGSTLDLFDRCPRSWRVDERWRPRPTPAVTDLAAWLAECSARELARDSGLHTICLRFGRVIDEAGSIATPFDPRWLHIEDAVAAVLRALAYPSGGWTVFHITAAGPRAKVRLGAAGRSPFSYLPRHDFRACWGPAGVAGGGDDRADVPWQEAFASLSASPDRAIRNVVIFGAAGPLAAAVARELAPTHTLRLTDLRPIVEAAAGEPQRPGFPLPVPLGPPHDCRVVDITDPAQVLGACAGMDAIVNCTVIRSDPVEAFRVNLLGAYNVMRAAVTGAIRRVVHTGPYMASPSGATGYAWDDAVCEDAPSRPGLGHRFQLYFHTKYLGQEICRVFAEYYGLQVPALLFCDFVSQDYPTAEEFHPFSVTFADAALAVRRALEVEELPSPFEVLHIGAELPHGRFPMHKAKRVLGWEARDNLRHLWEHE